MMRRQGLLAIVILACLCGCSLAPEYSRPAAPVPKEWPSGAAYGDVKKTTATPAAMALPWRQFFTDERLQKIIAMALDNNRDLRLASLNVARAQALYGLQRADLFPSVYAAGVMNKQLVPADLSTSGISNTATQYGVNLGISSWEIDFFGRIRSLTESALNQYFASEQAQRTAQIVLVSAVANAYLLLAADRENLRLASSTLETQRAYYRLIEKRRNAGLASELDLRRAQTQVDIARADTARYTQLIAQDENALNLLIGSQVSPDLLPTELASVKSPKQISPGLSSEVLLRRPDVVAAEHILKAAYANIGAARAAFFPRIALTASGGTVSADLSGLFKSGQSTWSFVPQITVPIFDARVRSAYAITKVDREIALTQYEKAILIAFREVADSLAVLGTVSQQVAAQESLVGAATETYRLSNLRYNKGFDSYLSVLDAQRSLYAAQQGLINLHLLRSANLVTLYKVLGGGT